MTLEQTIRKAIKIQKDLYEMLKQAIDANDFKTASKIAIHINELNNNIMNAFTKTGPV